MASPLEYTVVRKGLRLEVRVTCRHLRLRLLLKDRDGEWTDSRFWHRFPSDSRGVDFEEAEYFARVFGTVIEEGGSAQFSLAGRPCQAFRDGEKTETPIFLEIGSVPHTRVQLRLTEARKIHAYFRDYFDLTA